MGSVQKDFVLFQPEKNEIFKLILTVIVFLKFLGSSGSSKGYAPTSMTYNVTPHDHTSAI
jgi:hypothetical protein